MNKDQHFIESIIAAVTEYNGVRADVSGFDLEMLQAQFAGKICGLASIYRGTK